MTINPTLATTAQETMKLIEAGFQYFTMIEAHSTFLQQTSIPMGIYSTHKIGKTYTFAPKSEKTKTV